MLKKHLAPRDAETIQTSQDVIIIGGGVLGHAVAHEIAREGSARILHVYPTGYGRDCATTAAGAMISAFGEVTEGGEDLLSERKLDFRVRNQKAYPVWLAGIRELSGAALDVIPGIFMIANKHGRADLRNMDRLTSALNRFGSAWEHVSPQDIPGFAPLPEYAAEAAVYIPDDFCVDAVELLNALALAAAATGRCRHLPDTVTRIIPTRNNGWEIVTTGGHRHAAAELILCAGAHIPELLGEALLPYINLPALYFAKGIGIIVSGAPRVPHAIRTPNRSDACGVHIVPRSDGRLYIGASTHYGHATAAARGVTPGEVTAILGDTLRQINPQLRDTTIDEIRFGLRPMAESGAPLIGRTMLPGLSIATGTFRTGIVMAPLISKLLADAVLGRSGEANPWPIPTSAPAGSAANENLVLHHLNLGLRAYQDLKLGQCEGAATIALRHWNAYRSLAGSGADPRIIALMSEIERDPNSLNQATNL